MLRRSIRPLPALRGVHHSFFSVRADWYLIPSAWICYLFIILFHRNLWPEIEASVPWLGHLSMALFVPLLYLVWRQGKVRRHGLHLSRRDWLMGLWWLIVSGTCAFNVVIIIETWMALLVLGFLLAGGILFGFTIARLFRPRRHPEGGPIPDAPRRRRENSERWAALRGDLKRWGRRAILAAGMAGALFLWSTRSTGGPYVPAEFLVGPPVRLGENIADVTIQRTMYVGEVMGSLWEDIDGIYFQQTSYFAGNDDDESKFTTGPLKSVVYSFDEMNFYRPYTRWTAEKAIGICRRHYGQEGESRISYTIKKGTIETEYVSFRKTWKIDEMHAAVVTWVENDRGEGRQLMFIMGREEKPLELSGEVVDVYYQ